LGIPWQACSDTAWLPIAQSFSKAPKKR